MGVLVEQDRGLGHYGGTEPWQEGDGDEVRAARPLTGRARHPSTFQEHGLGTYGRTVASHPILTTPVGIR